MVDPPHTSKLRMLVLKPVTVKYLMKGDCRKDINEIILSGVCLNMGELSF